MVAHTFKIACEPWEFEQIKSLNYETFVEEVGQHSANADRQLTDSFHNENTYIICANGRQVLAMLAVRGKRPFSLDKKLANLDSYLPEDRSLCEVRLLAVRKQVRNTRIVRGLLAETVSYCLNQGYDTALISGILQQVKLYRHLGFVEFGPIVGNNGAHFQPMYLTIEAHKSAKSSFVHRGKPVNLLPGPIAISKSVSNALVAPELSHRSNEYTQLHQDTQERLCKITGAAHVQIFSGSGTLANEVIAGQLLLLPGKGLILSNGEFGERLIEQSRRFGLSFETLSLPWGQAYDQHEILAKTDGTSDLQWIWSVCAESSTGMLNDAAMLKQAAHDRGLYLCLDCISAIGNAPIDLRGVYLASACSSKGLRSVSGLALVFYNHTLSKPQRNLPVYLDLYAYEKANGIPFTISSNLVSAMNTALKESDIQDCITKVSNTDKWLRTKLAKLGLSTLVCDKMSCPGIITLGLKPPLNSKNAGDRLKEAGFLVSYESGYLLKRNWIQVCLMSDVRKGQLAGLVDELKMIIRDSESAIIKRL